MRSITNWQQILNGSFFSPSAVSMLLDEYQLYWFRRCYQSTEFAYFDKGKKKKKNTKRRTFWSKTPRHSCLGSLSISCRLCFESFPISIRLGYRIICRLLLVFLIKTIFWIGCMYSFSEKMYDLSILQDNFGYFTPFQMGHFWARKS